MATLNFVADVRSVHEFFESKLGYTKCIAFDENRTCAREREDLIHAVDRPAPNDSYDHLRESASQPTKLAQAFEQVRQIVEHPGMYAVVYRDRPTFLLDANIQGILHTKGARMVAAAVLNVSPDDPGLSVEPV